MKILVVFTGGTIGSEAKNSVINITNQPNSVVLDMYKQTHNLSNINFEIVQPFNILSENINLSFWTDLVNFLLNLDYKNYNGIIITHGSDTFAYTSALLGMVLSHFTIPVVMVCSNYVPTHEKSNALVNFSGAVSFIEAYPNMHGVFAAYANDLKNCEIFLSTRLLEADNYADKFSVFGDEGFDINQKSEVFKAVKNITFKHEVAVIHPYPGLNYDNFVFKENTKAILHLTYHSGTAEEKGIIKTIEKLKNILVFSISSIL